MDEKKKQEKYEEQKKKAVKEMERILEQIEQKENKAKIEAETLKKFIGNFVAKKCYSEKKNTFKLEFEREG